MKKLIKLLLCGIGLFCLGSGNTYAQSLAVKTNVLYDATTTFNLGLEVGLSRQWTLDINGNYNPWTFRDNKKIKHWLAQPELRYWLCEKFRGHFFGLHLHGGQFNAGGIKLPFDIGENGIGSHRYQGYLYGAGLSYGYHWMLGGRWGLEATIGAGYARMHYDTYRCVSCSGKLSTDNKNYWGITKIGFNLIYIIK